MEEHQKQEINWQIKRQKDSRDLARKMSDLVNDMSHNSEMFIEELTLRTHRTLQQKAIELVFRLIDKCGEYYDTDRSRYTDLRNDNAYKMCSEIRKLMTERSDLGARWWRQPLI